MVGVNVSRARMVQDFKDAVEGAELVGYNDEGLMCVWYGGYGFNVYDAVTDWHEVRVFSCGAIAGISPSDMDAEEKKLSEAKDRMEDEGFTVV